MEADNIIVRKADTKDKRKALVFLTEKGLEMRKVVREVVIEFNEKLYGHIPANEIKSFFKTMYKVDQLVSELLDNQTITTS